MRHGLSTAAALAAVVALAATLARAVCDPANCQFSDCKDVKGGIVHASEFYDCVVPFMPFDPVEAERDVASMEVITTAVDNSAPFYAENQGGGSAPFDAAAEAQLLRDNFPYANRWLFEEDIQQAYARAGSIATRGSIGWWRKCVNEALTPTTEDAHMQLPFAIRATERFGKDTYDIFVDVNGIVNETPRFENVSTDFYDAGAVRGLRIDEIEGVPARQWLQENAFDDGLFFKNSRWYDTRQAADALLSDNDFTDTDLHTGMGFRFETYRGSAVAALGTDGLAFKFVDRAGAVTTQQVPFLIVPSPAAFYGAADPIGVAGHGAALEAGNVFGLQGLCKDNFPFGPVGSTNFFSSTNLLGQELSDDAGDTGILSGGAKDMQICEFLACSLAFGPFFVNCNLPLGIPDAMPGGGMALDAPLIDLTGHDLLTEEGSWSWLVAQMTDNGTNPEVRFPELGQMRDEATVRRMVYEHFGHRGMPMAEEPAEDVAPTAMEDLEASLDMPHVGQWFDAPVFNGQASAHVLAAVGDIGSYGTVADYAWLRVRAIAVGGVIGGQELATQVALIEQVIHQWKTAACSKRKVLIDLSSSVGGGGDFVQVAVLGNLRPELFADGDLEQAYPNLATHARIDRTPGMLGTTVQDLHKSAVDNGLDAALATTGPFAPIVEIVLFEAFNINFRPVSAPLTIVRDAADLASSTVLVNGVNRIYSEPILPEAEFVDRYLDGGIFAGMLLPNGSVFNGYGVPTEECPTKLRGPEDVLVVVGPNTDGKAASAARALVDRAGAKIVNHGTFPTCDDPAADECAGRVYEQDQWGTAGTGLENFYNPFQTCYAYGINHNLAGGGTFFNGTWPTQSFFFDRVYDQYANVDRSDPESFYARQTAQPAMAADAHAAVTNEYNYNAGYYLNKVRKAAKFI